MGVVHPTPQDWQVPHAFYCSSFFSCYRPLPHRPPPLGQSIHQFASVFCASQLNPPFVSETTTKLFWRTNTCQFAPFGIVRAYRPRALHFAIVFLIYTSRISGGTHRNSLILHTSAPYPQRCLGPNLLVIKLTSVRESPLITPH